MRSLSLAILVLAACGSTYGKLRPETEIPALAPLRTAFDALPWKEARVPAGEAAGKPVSLALFAADGPPGPRLVLIHGVLSDRTTWRFLAGDLGRDHPLLLVDLPGCGASDRPDPRETGDSYYAPDSLARAVLLALRARGGEEKLVLVGHSLGGMVILRMLGNPSLRSEFADVVDRVESATLIASVDFALEKVHPGFRSIAETSGFALGLGSMLGVVKEKTSKAVLVGADDPALALTGEADRIIEILGDAPRRRAAQAMLRAAVPYTSDVRPDWPAIERIVADYAKVRQPCLIVWGSRDETFPVSMGYKLRAQLPDARLVVLERTKHSPHHEVPARCAELIRESLAGVRP